MTYNQSCKKCGLHKTAKSVCVPGRGSVKPRVMFVGQAPGGQEDEQNKCFIGPAGQLLMQAIKEFDIRPAFVTNLVKCFPTGDRDPKTEEIEACAGYLKNEIAELKPEIIVTLGNIPLKKLTGKVGVMQYSGTIVRQVNGYKIFSLLHPSYVLRYPHNLPKFEMHVRSLKELINPTKKEAHVTKIVDEHTMIGLLSYATQPVTFDFETTALSKTDGGIIRCIGLSFNNESFVVWKHNKNTFDNFVKEFLESNITKCAYNSVFETRWAIDEYGIEPKNLTLDPMLMHYLLDENSAHDLESVASSVLNVTQWDISNQMLEKGWTYATVPMENLVPYCGLDCHYTSRLVDPLYNKIREQGLEEIYSKLLLPLAKLCARLESRGMKIDKGWAADIDGRYAADQKELFARMRDLQKLPDTFNPNSSAQISNIMFKKLRLKVEERTDGGKMSTKESALKPLRGTHEFVDVYLNWKEKQTLRNNFLQKFPKFCDADDLVHPSFSPSFVVTGRLSVTKPPAQAVPTKPEVRGMFSSRFQYGKIISMDYDQLEMRLVASESGDDNLIQVFKRHEDPHNATAEKMFGPAFTKAERSIAKRVNFGIVYGISDYTLSREFHVPVQTAVEWLAKFRRAYPQVAIWMRKQHFEIKTHGFIKSKFGRVRHLPDAKVADSWQLERLLRQAGNFPIQSLGADITNLTAIYVDKALTRRSMNSLLFHQVHDSILIDATAGEVRLVQQLCRQVVIDRIQPFCKVEMSVSFEVGDRWGSNDD